MRKVTIPVAAAALVAVVLGIRMFAGGGVGQAQVNGDLLLTYNLGSTATSVTLGPPCLGNVSAGTLVQVDAVAVNAVDWASMDYVLNYPVGAGSVGISAPGPGSGGVEGGAFDYVPLNFADFANTFGSQNFLFPNSADANADYTTTEGVPDGASPHGVSMFDNSAAGNNGSGGMARFSLDTTGLVAGVYSLSLGTTGGFAGGVHSNAVGFLPDNFGSLQLAIGQACPVGTATPTPTPSPSATPTPTATAVGFDDAKAINITGTLGPELVMLFEPCIARGLTDCEVTHTHKVFTRNNADHTNTILTKYRVIGFPAVCTVNSSSASPNELFSDSSSYAPGEKKSFTVTVTYSCPASQAGNVPGAAFQLRLDVDHLGDDFPAADDEDSAPANNTIIKNKTISSL